MQIHINITRTSSNVSLFHFFVYFFSCCKLHDICIDDFGSDRVKCNFGERKKAEFLMKDFKYNKATNKCCKYFNLALYNLKGPSQPHLCFCLRVCFAIIFYSEHVETTEIAVKPLKITKHTFRNTT